MNLIHPPGYMYGRQTKCFSAGDIGIKEGIYGGFKSPTHAHEHALLCLVLKGNYIETYELKNFVRTTASVFFHPAGTSHASDFRASDNGKEVRLMRIELDPRRFAHTREYSTFLDHPTTFQSGIVTWLMMRLYHNFRLADASAQLAIEGLTLEIIAEASRKQTRIYQNKAPRWLEMAKDILHDRFTENLGLNEIAVIVGVHPVYLASEFRRQYKVTIGEFVRRLRIEDACRTLSTSNVSLANIALASGFSSQSHFSRVFKQTVGMTPLEYRNSFRSP